jgi:hypothetical protein
MAVALHLSWRPCYWWSDLLVFGSGLLLCVCACLWVQQLLFHLCCWEFTSLLMHILLPPVLIRKMCSSCTGPQFFFRRRWINLCLRSVAKQEEVQMESLTCKRYHHKKRVIEIKESSCHIIKEFDRVIEARCPVSHQHKGSVSQHKDLWLILHAMQPVVVRHLIEQIRCRTTKVPVTVVPVKQGCWLFFLACYLVTIGLGRIALYAKKAGHLDISWRKWWDLV